MDLKIIHEGVWKVVSPVDSRGNCRLEETITAMIGDTKLQKTALGFYALWSRIPVQGPIALGTNFYHRIDDENQICEFIKGNYRIPAFSGNGAIVVCADAFLKQSQRTTKAHKHSAIEMRRSYFEAVAQNQIGYV